MISECKRVGIPEPEFHADGSFVWVVFKYNAQVTAQVLKLVSLIGDNEMPVKKIMQDLSLNHRGYFLKEYLRPAIKEDLIAATYPDQPNHPKQKYSLTEKGKALLK